LDYPHIAYFDGDNENLKYAFQDTTGWHIELVDVPAAAGRFPSLALDATGFPHISYLDHLYNYDLRYAYKDLGGWHIEVVDSEGLIGRYTSLAVDASGRPHIGYQDYGNADLKYAYRTNAGWHVMTVDSVGMAGVATSIALDEAGLPHIVYWHMSYSDLRYVRATGQESIWLSGELVGTELVLTWSPIPGVAQYWIYGAANYPFFPLGPFPGTEYRITTLPNTTTSWGSTEGIGIPDAQWTYLVLAVDAMEFELGRSNRVGEHDFAIENP
jgi:hypothetical protein